MIRRIFLLLFTAIVIMQTIPVNGETETSVKVSSGAKHALVINDQGQIVSWGYNRFGQLGNETMISTLKPTFVKNIHDKSIIAVSAGMYHSSALTDKGTVWMWGWNNHGQIGIDSFIHEQSTIPIQINQQIYTEENGVQLSPIGDVVSIASGSNHMLALKSDGTVWAWGDNTNGQLGDQQSSSIVNRHIAQQISNLSDVIMISARGSTNLALKSDGTVWIWGENQLGGKLASIRTPIQIKEVTDVSYISAGSNHSLAVKKDGTVWTWGGYTSSEVEETKRPNLVHGLSSIVSVSTGVSHNLALKSDGTVWTWGTNEHGALGLYTNELFIETPVKIPNLEKIKEVSASDSFNLAINDQDKLFVWGRNDHGQLGLGSTENKQIPVLLPLQSVSGVELSHHSLTLKPGENFQLQANVLPADAVMKDVIWTSNNPQLVTVDANGKVTVQTKSTSLTNKTVITVKTLDGGYTDTCTITVKIPVTGIDLPHSKMILEQVGLYHEKIQLTPTIYPYNATDKRIIWSSSNPEIVKIDSLGNMTASQTGTATIKAMALDGGWQDEVTVTVIHPVNSISLENGKEEIHLGVGDNYQFNYAISPYSATDQRISAWISSNKDVATVSWNGKVTAKKVGETIIKVTTRHNSKSDTIKLIIHEKKDLVDRLVVDKQELSINVRESVELDVQVLPKTAKPDLVWSSLNEKIATVDQTGTVTGHATGTTTVRVQTKDGQKMADVEVTIGLLNGKWKIFKEKEFLSSKKDLKITFNTELIESTINSSNIYVLDRYGNKVNVTLKLLHNKKTVVISLQRQLYTNQTYTLYIEKDIRALVGQVLDYGVQMRFKVK